MSISEDLLNRAVDSIIRDAEDNFSLVKFGILKDLVQEGADFNRLTVGDGKSRIWIPSTMVWMTRLAGGIIDLEHLLKRGLMTNLSDDAWKQSNHAKDPMDMLVGWTGYINTIGMSDYVAYQDTLLSFGANPFADISRKRTGFLHRLIIEIPFNKANSNVGLWKVKQLLSSPYFTEDMRQRLVNEPDCYGRRPVDLAIDNLLNDTDTNESCVGALLLLFEYGVDIMAEIEKRLTPMHEIPRQMLEDEFPAALARMVAKNMEPSCSGQSIRARL